MAKRNRRIVLLLTCICSTVLVCVRCINNEKSVVVTNNKGETFAGSAACRTCHQAIYDSFLRTAHYLDSRPASKETIKGSFADTANRFLYNYDLNKMVVMENRSDGLYQAAYINKNTR